MNRGSLVSIRVGLGQTADEMGVAAVKPLKCLRRTVGKCIEKLEVVVGAYMQSLPENFRCNETLRWIAGIVPVNSAMLKCWMPELGHIEYCQAASFLGAAPFAKDRSKSTGARHFRGAAIAGHAMRSTWRQPARLHTTRI